MLYKNTNDAYGESGPFEVVSRIRPRTAEWAKNIGAKSMKTDTNPTCAMCGAEEILPGECPGGCDVLPIIRVERGEDAATYWGALLGSMAPLARVRLADRLRELIVGGEL